MVDMLEDLKNALRKIQQNREEELSTETILAKDHQKALLQLELPYSTKAGDIMIAQGEVGRVRDARRQAKVHAFSKTCVNEWVESDPTSKEQKEMFCDFLHQYAGFGFYRHEQLEKVKELSVQELFTTFPREGIIAAAIKTSPLAESLRVEYEKQANDLYAFLEKDTESPLIFRNKGPISLSELYKLFECLEKRAMKSTTTRSFYDILLCRTLFYAPLTAKKLFDLGAPQLKDKHYYLVSEGTEFPVPKSFVELWKAFGLAGRLFPYAFDEDLLSRKIRQLGERAKLTALLSMSVLKLSQQSIYQNELGLLPEVFGLLPRR